MRHQEDEDGRSGGGPKEPAGQWLPTRICGGGQGSEEDLTRTREGREGQRDNQAGEQTTGSVAAQTRRTPTPPTTTTRCQTHTPARAVTHKLMLVLNYVHER